MTESLTGQGNPSYTGIRNMPGPATITETGANPGPAVAVLEKTVDDLKDQTARADRVAQAKREIEEESGAPAAGMDEDPRYFRIQEELRQKWLSEHPGQDLLTEEGQNYNLGYIDPDKQDLPTLRSDSDKLFRERYPGDAKDYDAKELTRIYKESNQDPAIKKVERDILTATNLDPEVRQAMRGTDANKYREAWMAVNAREYRSAWDAFIRRFPEKAKAYGERGRSEIVQALQRQEQSTQLQAKKVESLAQERVEAPVQVQQEQASEVDSGVAQKAAETPAKNKKEFKVPKSVLEDKVYQEAYREVLGIAKKQVGEKDKINEELVAKEAFKLYLKKKFRGLLSAIAATFVAPLFSAGYSAGQQVVQPAR